jgi:hypothetical protein
MTMWTANKVLELVERVTEQSLDFDDELLDSGRVDSLGLIEIGITLRLPFDRYTRESWGTVRRLYKEVSYCTCSGLLTDGESPTQRD